MFAPFFITSLSLAGPINYNLGMERLIAHVDMDAFYASVEVLANPDLSGKPVIVGGTSNRGVVSSASYEARSFGVRSAMPVIRARQLCPRGIFLPVRMKSYLAVSRKVMEVFRDFSPVVEPISVDEAFLDLSGTGRLYGSPQNTGRQLKNLVKDKTGLICSVGLAPNRLVAKIASDYDKPDGLVIVSDDNTSAFLAPLSVARLPGVGPKLVKKLKLMSVEKIADLVALDEKDLLRLFGSNGPRLFNMARGLDDTPVFSGRERPKSISAEQTLSEDVIRKDQLEPLLAGQALRVSRSLRKKGLLAKTVTIKIKHSDFTLKTRSATLPEPFDSTKVILKTGIGILSRYNLASPVRLIGLGVSNLEDPILAQPGLFGLTNEHFQDQKVDRALDDILSKFGSRAIKMGLSVKKK